MKKIIFNVVSGISLVALLCIFPTSETVATGGERNDNTCYVSGWATYHSSGACFGSNGNCYYKNEVPCIIIIGGDGP